eukprot:Sdes_comp9730_c0_seq1m1235
MSQELQSVVGFPSQGPDPYGFNTNPININSSQYSNSPPLSEFNAAPQFQFFNSYDQQNNNQLFTTNNPQPSQTSSLNGFINPPNSQSYAGLNFEGEPPLLEELGINFDQIKKRTWSVLHPLNTPLPNIMDDYDLAAPLLFGIAFGSFLLMTGKIHFGYIYGVGLVGCIAIWAILNFMSDRGISFAVCMSVLGYCLLPVVFLASVAVVLDFRNLIGFLFCGGFILWSTFSSSKIFVTVLGMKEQQVLVAYPCLLLYGIFALLAVF